MSFQQVPTLEEFQKQLADAGDKPVFVDFFATWCGKCQMLEPELEEIAENNKDKAIFLKVDVEENDEVAMEYEVECLPTLIHIKSKEKVSEMKGSKLDKIKKFFEDEIAKY